MRRRRERGALAEFFDVEDRERAADDLNIFEADIVIDDDGSIHTIPWVVDRYGSRPAPPPPCSSPCELPDCPVCAIGHGEVADLNAWRARRAERQRVEEEGPDEED